MSRTLLINLKTSEIASTPNFVMPLGILSIAAYLRSNGEEADILDLNVTDFNIDSVLKYNFVGLSVMVSSQFKRAYQICQDIKLMAPAIRTIVGGSHISQFKNDIIKNCPEIDFVVAGEGEQKLLSIIREGKIKDVGFIENLDSLPWAAYHLLNFEDYKRDYSNWNNPYNADLGIRVPLVTSRGCPNNCNFCSLTKHMGMKYRPMSKDNVVDLIEYLHNIYNANYFAFYDANFTLQAKRVIEISNEIVKRNLKVYLDLPTGLPINNKTSEMVDALVEAGLIRTTLSVESGDETIRNKVMQKKSKQTDIFSAIEAIRKYPQVYLLTDFVIGMPEETEASITATYNLLKDLDTDDITISVATPYPETALYDQCLKHSLFWHDIDLNELYKSDDFCHVNLKRFNIKPYDLDEDTLVYFRDKLIDLKGIKLENYKKRVGKNV